MDGGPAPEDPDLKNKWFDHWLQGADNGVEATPSVNLYPIGGERWEHHATWPLPDASYKRAYLGGGKTLSFAAPAEGGGDRAPLLPASSPCSRMTTQWTAGAAQGPCETDNRTWEATSLTYTSEPLAEDTKLTGPVVADVAPSGESNQVTAGFLLASQRAVNPARSTFDANGTMIRPSHPFTRESHRIRLTIGSADTPSTAPPVPALADSLGGEIRVLHGGRYESHVLLPFAPG